MIMYLSDNSSFLTVGILFLPVAVEEPVLGGVYLDVILTNLVCRLCPKARYAF